MLFRQPGPALNAIEHGAPNQHLDGIDWRIPERASRHLLSAKCEIAVTLIKFVQTAAANQLLVLGLNQNSEVAQ